MEQELVVKIKKGEQLVKVGLAQIMIMDNCDTDQVIITEQATKLKEHLMSFHDLLHGTKKMWSFKCKEVGWASRVVSQKLEELEDGCKKGDLLVKMAKNLVASIKTSQA